MSEGRRGPRLASLEPLRHRDYALVWWAALVSNVGSWVQTVAVGVLITKLTGQAGWTGLVAAAAFLPIGLLSPVGGAVADRVNRRRWLILTTLGETSFAVALAVCSATGRTNAAELTLLVLGGGSMTALSLPAFQAILPDLVPREQLLAASSLSMAQWNFGRVVGPALAGLILALGSFTWAFTVNAASFGAVLIALCFVRLPEAPATDEAGLWSRIAAGAKAAAAEPGCRLAIASITVVALLLSPFIALVPAVALKLFHDGRTGTSVLITAQGVGAVVGALLVASAAARFGRRRLLTVNFLVLPAVLLVYAASPDLPFGAIALLVVGMAYIGVLSGLGTVMQLRAPAEMRARILSLYMVALGVVYPLGAVIQGFLGDRLGLREVTAGTALIFIGIVLGVRTLRPDLATAFDDPVTAGSDTAGGTFGGTVADAAVVPLPPPAQVS